MSYTTGNDDNTWLNRLPIIGSRTTSMSFRKAEPSDSSNEKVDTGGLVPPGTLPPVGGLPGGLLSRVSTKGRDDNTWSVSDTAIAPRRRRDGLGRPVGGGNRQVPPPRQGQNDIEPVEVFQEGRDIVIENEQGDVITQARTSPHHHEHSVGPLDTTALNKKLEDTKNDIHDRLSSDAGNRNKTSAAAASGTKSPDPSRHKPVMAYRFDDNIIVEDADGEVIKRYKIPKSRPALSGGRKSSNGSFIPAQQIQRLGSWFGGKGHDKSKKDRANDSGSEGMRTESDDDEEKGPKFRLRDQKGRKMSKQEFIKELQRMDPHARKAMASETSLAMEGSSQGETHGHGHPAKDMRRAFLDHFHREKHNLQVKGVTAPAEPGTGTAVITNVLSSSSDPASPSVGNTGFALVDSQEKVIPYHATSDTDLRALKTGRGEGIIAASSGDEETWAERKRREAALGLRSNDADSDSEDDDTPRVQGANPHQRKPTGTGTRTPGIRFANVERREGVEVEISRPGSSGAGAGRQTTPENGPEDKPTELDGSGGEAMGRSTGLQWGDVVWGDRDTAKGKQKEA